MNFYRNQLFLSSVVFVGAFRYRAIANNSKLSQTILGGLSLLSCILISWYSYTLQKHRKSVQLHQLYKMRKYMVQENKSLLVEVSFFRLSGCTCWDISEALLHIKKVFSQISYIKRENIGKRKSVSIEISFFRSSGWLFGKFPMLYLLVHRKSFQSH